MSSKHLRHLTLATLAATIAGTVCASAHAPATRYTDQTLHRFCYNCAGGALPDSGLLIDQGGNLYGATVQGGDGCGVVYKLALVSGRWKETLLHKFGGDGLCNPVGDLIVDKDGNFYGVTYDGGDYGYGAVYKLTHGHNGWSLSTLHSFGHGSAPAENPAAGLTYAGQYGGKPWDESSPLFGTTLNGGAYGNGAAYEYDANGTYSIIHNFQSSAQPNPLYEDSAGNLYGTTQIGGQNGHGLMFLLTNGSWDETVIHQFCSQTNCSDGGTPYGRLTMDSSGDLIGTTSAGGKNGWGNVFEYTTGAQYNVLYNFCSVGVYCSDGALPAAGVNIDSSGNLFGTTLTGGYGSSGFGTVFELAYANGNWTESVLHKFCRRINCPDGAHPATSLIMDPSGSIYGTTHGTADYGGDTYGTVFKLMP
jgi:uncharacterized repeat protein (TIGR03803 family)